MKPATIILTTLLLVAFATPGHAYRLPAYRMSAEEQSAPAEVSLKKYRSKIEEIRKLAPIGVVENRRRNYKAKLSRKARKMVRNFTQLKYAASFWEYAFDLKAKLKSLHGDPDDADIGAEADALAKAIVQKLYDISQEYRVSVSAIINNVLINSGAKKKGFCYHYVEDLMRVLRGHRWRFFDMHWGEAWPETFRENNALIITAKDAPFETGLAVDAWRSAGKPFWSKVQGDRFPWTEAFDVEIEDQ
ncbi:MAG: hypothetical protein ABH871_07035 [Pseudomonadota bacterium]